MHLAAPPERVYDTLDSDEGRASFWAEAAVEDEGRIDFEFINGVTCQCRILERRRPTVWALDYMGSEAQFELASDGRGGTDLLLTQKDVSAEDWNEVHAGWLNVLFPLKAWIVHGIDLRNRDRNRTWDQGYADQ